MKFEKNDKYFTIAVYVVLTLLTVIGGAIILLNINLIWGDLAELVARVIDLFKPLIIGLILAYLLDPLVTFYAKKCTNHPLAKIRKKRRRNYNDGKYPKESARVIGTLFTVITLIMVFTLFVLVIQLNIKQVIEDGMVEGFVVGIGHYVNYFEDVLNDVNETVNELQMSFVSNEIISTVYSGIDSLTSTIVVKSTNSIKNIAANVVNIVLGIIIAFYIVLDKKLFNNLTNKFLKNIFKPKIAKEIRAVGQDIDYVFSGYIRGQAIDAFIMMVLISVALIIIGLDFAIIIGIIAGLFNIIPYFGPIVGFVLAGLIGVIGQTPQKALYAVIAVMIIQQIDGWFIAPKVVGENVKLHPLIVLLAIIIGGKLFGLIGILLGVPVAALVRVLIKRYANPKLVKKG